MRKQMARALRRICWDYADASGRGDGLAPDALCAPLHNQGFDALLLLQRPNASETETFSHDGLRAVAGACDRAGLGLLVDLALVWPREAPCDGPFTFGHQAGSGALDPRYAESPGQWHAQGQSPWPLPSQIDAWADSLCAWAGQGLGGVRCTRLNALPPSAWQTLIGCVHAQHPKFLFIAWTPGQAPGPLQTLASSGFDASVLSLPWWDGRASWLLEERQRLSRLGQVFAPLRDPDSGVGEISPSRLWLAAFLGAGLMLPRDALAALGEKTVTDVNTWHAHAQHAGADGDCTDDGFRCLAGPLAPVSAWARTHPSPCALVLNPDRQRSHAVDWAMLAARLPGDYVLQADAALALPAALAPGGLVLAELRPASMVAGATASAVSPSSSASCATSSTPAAFTASESAARIPLPDVAGIQSPRIAIERVTPCVDNGQFAARSCLGDDVAVSADIFGDGHDLLAARLLWRAAGQTEWTGIPMRALGNDRWEAHFQPRCLGPHEYCIQAWRDAWGTHAEYLRKKAQAGQDVQLDIDEGLQMLAQAAQRLQAINPNAAAQIERFCEQCICEPARESDRASKPGPADETEHTSKADRTHETGRTREHSEAAASAMTYGRDWQASACGILLSPELAALMARADAHAFENISPSLPLFVDRRAGRFASWYELFPRSQSPMPGRHGTLRDVMARLPAIARMGFDVLYFPPIHPIGQASRKGRNNALRAEPGDPGSPYAIGSSDGGHDAIHPELGTFDDFSALVQAARRHGMELALDFAIQCSPDHPWLTEHPDWFDWRADGTLRHAENPPKRYEDIVNPSFYDAQGNPRMDLWQTLRDIVLFWIGQGVQTFRVDNPHTKPLPFWQWMIAQVKARHPGTLFLAEAFTRPAMMHRLAKIGFSQSYTYFTWRTTRQELTDYLTELNAQPSAEYFRPNFFVNTPDINPYFLQDGGRAGFLIRAVLAATLSGLWGIYSGFELCEAAALPGREEYLDAEKYELRRRDWAQPGNIIDEITHLNALRRANPALHSHLGVRFHHIDNDRILFFSKATAQGDSVVLVAVSLDPHSPQSGTLQLPLWQWSMPDDGVARLQDLLGGGQFELAGAWHTVSLSPQQPYLIWRLLPQAS